MLEEQVIMMKRTTVLYLISFLLLFAAVSCTTEDDSVINEYLDGLTGQVYTDPAGDIFGKENRQHDILSIEVYHDAELNALLFKIMFADTVLPVTFPENLEQLYGYLEIDVDQIQDSGSLSTIDQFITQGGLDEPLTNMFVDYTVVLHFYDARFGTVDINAPGPSDDLAGYAAAVYEENGCLVIVPIDVLAFYNGRVAFALVIGSAPEATDLTVAYTYNSVP